MKQPISQRGLKRVNKEYNDYFKANNQQPAMNYAVQLLEKEKEMLEKILSEWDETEYPEARKDRDKKLKDLNKALKLIQDAA